MAGVHQSCHLNVSMERHRALSCVLPTCRVENKLEEETRMACLSNLQITQTSGKNGLREASHHQRAGVDQGRARGRSRAPFNNTVPRRSTAWARLVPVQLLWARVWPEMTKQPCLHLSSLTFHKVSFFSGCKIGTKNPSLLSYGLALRTN